MRKFQKYFCVECFPLCKIPNVACNTSNSITNQTVSLQDLYFCMILHKWCFQWWKPTGGRYIYQEINSSEDRPPGFGNWLVSADREAGEPEGYLGDSRAPQCLCYGLAYSANFCYKLGLTWLEVMGESESLFIFSLFIFEGIIWPADLFKMKWLSQRVCRSMPGYGSGQVCPYAYSEIVFRMFL